MTSSAGRLYALAVAVVVFFVAWATIAARPWAAGRTDARLAGLTAREQQLRREAALVHAIVRRRWANYRLKLAQRKAALASQAVAPSAAPSVRIVTLPPLTITRTS
jgi:hypothetical protein